jgi:hypothetical protein
MPAVDGSALTGIEALPSGGSVGQLITNTASGTGTWQDAGGGGGAWVEVASATISSTVYEIEFTGLDATYETYIMVAEGLQFTNNNSRVMLQLMNGSSGVTSNVFRYRAIHAYNNESNDYYNTGSPFTAFRCTSPQGTANQPMFFQANINGLASARETIVDFSGTISTSNDVEYSVMAGKQTHATAYDGIKVFGEDFIAGKVTIYGLVSS